MAATRFKLFLSSAVARNPSTNSATAQRSYVKAVQGAQIGLFLKDLSKNILTTVASPNSWQLLGLFRKCNFFLKKGPNPTSFCLFSFFSHDRYSTNTINEKAYMACLGLEPGAAGW